MFRISLLLLLSFASFTLSSDDGLCSMEPTEEESCGGGTNRTLEDFIAKQVYKKRSFTSDYDFEIRFALDDADDIIYGASEEAIKMYDEILKTHPKSMRARYARTRAIAELVAQKIENDAPKEEIEKLKREVMESYLALTSLSKDEAMEPIVMSAYSQGIGFADQYHLQEDKLRIMRAASESDAFTDKAAIASHMGFLFIHLDRLEEAENEFAKAANLTPAIQYQLMQGVMMKMNGKKKEANKMLRDLDFYVDAGQYLSELADHFSHVGFSLLHINRTDIFRRVNEEASKLHIFLSALRRPIELVTDLESNQMKWDLENDEDLEPVKEHLLELKENWEKIREEALELIKADNLTAEWNTNGQKVIKGDWRELPLYSWGKRRFHGCTAAPTTCNLLKRFKLSSTCRRCTTKFSVLAPGTVLYPHCGPTNGRLRVHLPLKAGGAKMRLVKEEVEWKEGEMVIFDDSYEQEIKNESDEQTVLLIVDFEHPAMSMTLDRKKAPFTRVGQAKFFM